MNLISSPFIIFLIECMGIVSFSISATVVAIQKRLDIVGAVIFAMITCFGGGFLRDLTIGVTPPLLLCSSEFFILMMVCFAVSFIIYHISFMKKTEELLSKNLHNFWIELTDSIGLAAFCVVGVDSALAARPESDTLVLLFCGCITAVGGSVLRDIMSAEIPGLFRKHVYLLPAIGGVLIYVLMLPLHTDLLSHLLAMAFILTLRLLAIHYKWNLPRPGMRPEATEQKAEQPAPKEKILR